MLVILLKFVFIHFLGSFNKTSITSPLTQIEYTGEISEKGLSITAKPPFYDFFIEMYKRLSGSVK